ncbi:flavin-containing monooxygenase [Nocardia sp. NPDC059240]|uniref:flavin-containing monooxygenase n=1 Tax=Nocardia sp. NPDC059240 TaxID=3346786 RepID=UPI0036BC1895
MDTTLEYGEHLAEENLTDIEAVIIGGGMSGIRTAIELKRQGLGFVLLERSDGLGGVWNHNRYPGIGCDVPSPTYQYGFALNNWSRLFAPGQEIREYLERVAAENDIVRHVRFGTELLDSVWSDSEKKWLCETNKGLIRARFLIVATGQNDRASIPEIPGADKFDGDIFHSHDWPADFDAEGKRIAVVGTGASAIQFVPEIQPSAERLVILQRTPSWVVPKPDVVHEERSPRRAKLRQRILRAFIWFLLEFLVITVKYPRLAILPERSARKHLEQQIADPELRKVLTPDYKAGCKRLLLSNAWYPAVSAPNVDYLPSALSEIREKSVVTSSGREFEVDTIIWGTGFNFGSPIFDRIRDRKGRLLAERFEEMPRTYRATTIVDCPNFFLVGGVHSGTASVFIGCEAQARYVGSAIQIMRRQGIETVEPKPHKEQAWMDYRDSYLSGFVFTTGCKTYYLTSKGHNLAMWPGSPSGMVRKLRKFDIKNYQVTATSDVSRSHEALRVTG